MGCGPISSYIALLVSWSRRVKIPSPVSGIAEIVHTIHHTYHVPSPPDYVKVHVPGPTVVKPVREPRDPEGVHDSPWIWRFLVNTEVGGCNDEDEVKIACWWLEVLNFFGSEIWMPWTFFRCKNRGCQTNSPFDFHYHNFQNSVPPFVTVPNSSLFPQNLPSKMLNEFLQVLSLEPMQSQRRLKQHPGRRAWQGGCSRERATTGTRGHGSSVGEIYWKKDEVLPPKHRQIGARLFFDMFFSQLATSEMLWTSKKLRK